MSNDVRHLDRAAIESILPHRGRALMLDRAEVGEDTAIGYFVVTEEICEVAERQDSSCDQS